MLDNPILHSVRDELLTEAKLSPGLLADLANLERYVSETYSPPSRRSTKSRAVPPDRPA